MPVLPSYVKIGQVSGSSLVASVDTVGDVDTAPDAAFPEGSTFTFDPSIQYLRFTGAHQTVYLQSCSAVVAADGSITTPDGDPLFLIANIGQGDDEAGQRDWYWKVTPAIAGMGIIPAFRLDVTADGIVYLTEQQPVPVSPTLSALKGDTGAEGAPGVNTPPAGTPDDYVACSVGGVVSWRDPASLGLVGSTVTVDGTAGTATVAQGATSAVVYQKAKADTLLGAKVDTAALGALNGVATLGADGKLTAAQAPVTVTDHGDGTFTVTANGGASETTYTKAELDTLLGTSGATLTYSGTIQAQDYTAAPNEIVRTDNTTNSLTVTLPAATAGRRQAVGNIGLTEPNKTTIDAGLDGTGAQQSFIGGATTVDIDRQGMKYEFEAVSGGVWAIQSISVPPATLDAEYDAAGTAAGVSTALSAELQNVQASISNPPVVLQLRGPSGNLAVGPIAPPGVWHESGFQDRPVLSVRTYVGTAPAGADLVIPVTVAGNTVYTITVPAGQTSAVDVNPNSGAGFTIPNQTMVNFAASQVGSTTPGANILVIFSSQANAGIPATLGSVGGLSLTAQPAAAVVSWSYTSVDDNDDLDHFEIRWTTALTAPQTLSDGTAGPDVSGFLASPTDQLSGLPYDTDVQVSVFAVGANGAVGVPTSGSVHTLAKDTTAPLPGTLTVQSKGSTSATLQYTADASATDIAGIWLREARSSVNPPTTTTSGHPANSGANGTGPGLWVPVDPATRTANVSITDMLPSTNFAFSAFPQDTSGNVSATGAGVHFFTSAAPTTGQGASQKVPMTFTQSYFQDFSTITTATLTNDFALDQGWAHQDQGPSARSNWAVIADPANPGHNKLRLSGQWIDGGWFKPGNSVYTNHPTWADGVTTGSGWYGARGNIRNQTKTYGAWEIVCATAAPWGNSWKAGNIQNWPSATGVWPQGEDDVREGFQNNGALEINIHYYPGSGTRSAGTQITVSVTGDPTVKQTITYVKEKPNATTGDPARLRVWYNGVLAFDTGQPSTSTGPTPAGTSQTKINYVLGDPQAWDLGFSLAYTNYSSGATFTAATGAGAAQRQPQYFDIYSITMWDAPA